MATTNDITGDSIRSKPNTKSFDDSFERIFGKKNDKSSEVSKEKSDSMAADDQHVKRK
jgi:hypothetical protein